MSETVTHSHIGPSGAHRWMNCAASVGFIERLGLYSEESGEEAARGTVAHFVGSECLINDQEAWEYAGNVYKEGQWTFTVDEDMAVSAQRYVDLVREIFKQYESKGAILHIERRVRSACDPEAFGTSDCVIEVPGDRIIIIDFKNGMVVVEPHDEQLRLYGEYSYECRGDSMRGEGEPTVVELIICQPRAMHSKGPVRRHETTVAELTGWLESTVVPAIHATRDPNAQFVQGSWCTYCPALAHCALWQDSIVQVPAQMVDRTSFLSDEQITKFRAMRKMVTKFFDAVDVEAYQRVIVQQKIIPGCKPVHKLGDRAWRTSMLVPDPLNPAQQIELTIVKLLEGKFGAKAYPDKKLRSPAQIEKMPGGKDIVSQWAFKPTTGLTIADDNDPREPAVGLMDLASKQDATVRDADNGPLVI